MNTRFLLPCTALALFTPAVTASAQDAANAPASAPAVNTTPAIPSKAVADFYKRLQTAKTIGFTATYYANSTEALGFLQLNTYAVQAQRPNLFAARGNPALMRVITESDGEHMEFLSNLFNVSVSDGRTMLQFDPRSHAYERSPAPANFADAQGALQSVRPQTALNPDMLNGFAPAPNEEVWRAPAIVFARANRDNPRGLETEKLYFRADTGELMRYSSYFQYEFKGPLREQERVEYSDWKLNARVSRSAFTFALPADARAFPAVTRKTAAVAPPAAPAARP